MDLNREYSYDASPTEVYAMFVDQAFVERRLDATGALSRTAELTPEGGGIEIVTRRVLPPHVPDFVRKFVGDSIELDEVEHWGEAAPDGSRTGTVHVDIKGAPVKLDAATALRPTATGSAYTVTGTVKASVPLFGRKIEDATGPAVTAALDREAEVGRAWLAGER